MTALNDSSNLLEQVLKLPVMFEQTIPTSFLDGNGHMNMMYYTDLGNRALYAFFTDVGIFKAKRDKVFHTEDFAKRDRSTFALQQFLNYLREVREGDEVAVHSGLIGYDAKRLHFMHYVVNRTRQTIASSDERLAIYIDMNTRRSTPFEPDILERLAAAQARYDSLGWKPQLSGAIKLKN